MDKAAFLKPVLELVEPGLYVRSLTWAQRRDFDTILNGEAQEDRISLLLSFCVCDEQAEPVFTEAECNQLSSVLYVRLLQAAIRLNKVDQAAIDLEKKDSQN